MISLNAILDTTLYPGKSEVSLTKSQKSTKIIHSEQKSAAHSWKNCMFWVWYQQSGIWKEPAKFQQAHSVADDFQSWWFAIKCLKISKMLRSSWNMDMLELEQRWGWRFVENNQFTKFNCYLRLLRIQLFLSPAPWKTSLLGSTVPRSDNTFWSTTTCVMIMI